MDCLPWINDAVCRCFLHRAMSFEIGIWAEKRGHYNRSEWGLGRSRSSSKTTTATWVIQTLSQSAYQSIAAKASCHYMPSPFHPQPCRVLLYHQDFLSFSQCLSPSNVPVKLLSFSYFSNERMSCTGRRAHTWVSIEYPLARSPRHSRNRTYTHKWWWWMLFYQTFKLTA